MNDRVYRQRVQRCNEMMREEGINVLLLTKPSNMFYLTGDGRLCAYTMVTVDGKVVLGVPKTDTDDVKQLACFDDVAGFEDEVGMIHSIAHYFTHFAIEQGAMGVENTFLTQSMMAMLTHPHAKPAGVTVKDCTPIMSRLRMVKEGEEIDRIRTAAVVAGIGMKAAIKGMKAGVTESQIAAEAEYAMRQAGAEDFWRSYVSSGPRTSIAHGLPTTRKLQPRDLVMIDVHPIVAGYSADICRTVCVGKATAEQQAVYDLYLKALRATIAQVRAGVSIVDLDDTMHRVIKEGGQGDHVFGPPIHGVGIDFEESPLPPGHAFFHGEKAPPPLGAGVVIAIGNCGIYAGPWGVRMEDTVLVDKEGPVVLTDYQCSLEPT